MPPVRKWSYHFELRIVRHLAGQAVESGSTATLEVCVSGEPDELRWTKNGVEVSRARYHCMSRLELIANFR